MGELKELDSETKVDEHDDRKIFCSRVPKDFDEEILKRVLEENFGVDSVEKVSFLKKNDEDDSTTADRQKSMKENNEESQHRGFAFVIMNSVENKDKALDAGTVRGGVKSSSKRKHTIYLRPIVRDDCDENEKEEENERSVCFLWKNFRCQYGDQCKFSHTGKGGCISVGEKTADKKKQKCFAFKKKGKCKAGDSCPFSHDISNAMKKVDENSNSNKDKKTKDCINWKSKGKCRKGNKCPYRHDKCILDKFLCKKAKAATSQNEKKTKERQPLSVRVFGLNYDTGEDDVKNYFKECGQIVEVTFPTFEDSGRSKGYCGILFQSPKAVAKAVEMDGMELHGRWLSVQAGKMYLKQWEKRESERSAISTITEVKPMEEKRKLIGEYGQKVKRRKTHGFAE